MQGRQNARSWRGHAGGLEPPWRGYRLATLKRLAHLPPFSSPVSCPPLSPQSAPFGSLPLLPQKCPSCPDLGLLTWSLLWPCLLSLCQRFGNAGPAMASVTGRTHPDAPVGIKALLGWFLTHVSPSGSASSLSSRCGCRECPPSTSASHMLKAKSSDSPPSPPLQAASLGPRTSQAPSPFYSRNILSRARDSVSSRGP